MRNRWWLLVAVFLGTAWAGKGNGNGGGGGGGNDPVPPGTIYFLDGGSVLADGSGEASLPGAFEAQPSYALHGGQRWFLRTVFDGADNPDGRNSSRILAASEDGSTTVDLTPSTGTEWRTSGMGWQVRWAKDDPDTAADESDTFLSYGAVEWYGSGALDADSHVFTVALSWGSGGPSLAGTPASVVTAGLEATQAGIGFAESEIMNHDWAPDGGRLVYELWASQGDPSTADLRVKTVGGGDVFVTPGMLPEWAPDGGLIVFENKQSGAWGIWTVDPDSASSESALLLDGGKNRYDSPRWSPDSGHVCFRRTARRSGGIARVALSGGSVVDVLAGEQPTGWR